MLCYPHCSTLSTILFSIVTPNCGLDSGSTTCSLFNIVDNIEQCGQHNIVHSCFQQLVIFCYVDLSKSATK